MPSLFSKPAMRHFRLGFLILFTAPLLTACLTPDINTRQITRDTQKLCARDGGKVVNGKITGGGVFFVRFDGFKEFGIDSFDAPILDSILNPDGISLTLETVRKLAAPDRNDDRFGHPLRNGTLDFYDLYVEPSRTISINRSVIPKDGAIGVYRIRLADLEDQRCSLFKQQMAKIIPADARGMPNYRSMAEINSRGQCYYAEYLGPLEDYTLTNYLSYHYGIFDKEHTIIKRVSVIYDTQADRLLASRVNYGYEKMYNWGMWSAGCSNISERYSGPAISEAVGIYDPE